MTHRKWLAGMIALLLVGCGSYKHSPINVKQTESVATPEAATAEAEESADQGFSSEEVNGMVVEADTLANEPQIATEEEKSFNDAMTAEPDETAFAATDMAAEIEASFAKNQNANANANVKAMGTIKTLVKNLAAAAKNGKKKRTKNIAVQLLKVIMKDAAKKDANKDQAKVKELNAKVSDLVKKIVEAANKKKKADLKKAVEDLIKLLS